MPNVDTADDARRQLTVWYVESLRPRVVRAVKDGRVSVACARALESSLRQLFEPRAPALQPIASDRRKTRTP